MRVMFTSFKSFSSLFNPNFLEIIIFFHQNNSFKHSVYFDEPNSNSFVNEVYFYNIRIISFMDVNKWNESEQQRIKAKKAHTKHKANVGRLICCVFSHFILLYTKQCEKSLKHTIKWDRKLAYSLQHKKATNDQM